MATNSGRNLSLLESTAMVITLPRAATSTASMGPLTGSGTPRQRRQRHLEDQLHHYQWFGSQSLPWLGDPPIAAPGSRGVEFSGTAPFRWLRPSGEYVFQNDARKPRHNLPHPQTRFSPCRSSGNNTSVGGPDMAIWDPEAQKLFPLVPGQFRAICVAERIWRLLMTSL